MRAQELSQQRTGLADGQENCVTVVVVDVVNGVDETVVVEIPGGTVVDNTVVLETALDVSVELAKMDVVV